MVNLGICWCLYYSVFYWIFEGIDRNIDYFVWYKFYLNNLIFYRDLLIFYNVNYY